MFFFGQHYRNIHVLGLSLGLCALQALFGTGLRPIQKQGLESPDYPNQLAVHYSSPPNYDYETH